MRNGHICRLSYWICYLMKYRSGTIMDTELVLRGFFKTIIGRLVYRLHKALQDLH